MRTQADVLSVAQERTRNEIRTPSLDGILTFSASSESTGTHVGRDFSDSERVRGNYCLDLYATPADALLIAALQVARAAQQIAGAVEDAQVRGLAQFIAQKASSLHRGIEHLIDHHALMTMTEATFQAQVRGAKEEQR